MVMVKKWLFFHLFLANIGKKNLFSNIKEWKTAFLGYKKRPSKSLKIAIFRSGLTHGFGPKMSIFPTFLGNIVQENVLYDIL